MTYNNPIDEFDKLSEQERSKFIMALFKGSSGSGKSVAAGSFPEVAFFDFDNKTDHVRKYYRNHGPKTDIYSKVYGAHNIWKMLTILEGLLKTCPFHTVVIDSITSLTMSIVNYQLKNKYPPSERSKESSIKNKDGGIIVPDWDEYKGETVFVTQLLDLCKALASTQCHVIWTCHPLPKLKLEGSAGRVSSVTVTNSIVTYGSKTAALIPTYFSEVYHFGTEVGINFGDETRYLCTTKGVAEEFAGTALDIPSTIDWTDSNFYDKLFNESHKTDTAQEGE